MEFEREVEKVPHKFADDEVEFAWVIGADAEVRWMQTEVDLPGRSKVNSATLIVTVPDSEKECGKRTIVLQFVSPDAVFKAMSPQMLFLEEMFGNVIAAAGANKAISDYMSAAHKDLTGETLTDGTSMLDQIVKAAIAKFKKDKGEEGEEPRPTKRANPFKKRTKSDDPSLN